MEPHESFGDRLKWAEEQGLKNLQEKFTTGDNMNKEAQTTLTYVFTGMGGTFAFMSKGLDGPLTSFVFGNVILCGWFTILGVILVTRTLMLGAFPSPFQQPKNLTKDPHVDLDTVRLAEIRNIDKRIEDATAWIVRKSRTINRIRAALLGSPVIFLFAVIAYQHWRDLG